MKETTALVGIAVDVSATMRQTIRSSREKHLSRLAGFQQALESAVSTSLQQDQGARIERGMEDAGPRIFVYAFGLSREPAVIDLLSLIRAAGNVATAREIDALTQRFTKELRSRYSGLEGIGGLARSFGFGGLVDSAAQGLRSSAEKEIRECVEKELMARLRREVNRLGDTTLRPSELAEFWSGSTPSLEEAGRFIFGSRATKQCLEKVALRFRREIARQPADTLRLLVLITDGEAADGDTAAELQRIKSLGVVISTCFITGARQGGDKHLCAGPSDKWPEAAKNMFAAASGVEEDPLFHGLLAGRGWVLEDESRLFVQADHTDMLEEFISATLARLMV